VLLLLQERVVLVEMPLEMLQGGVGLLAVLALARFLTETRGVRAEKRRSG